MSSEKSSGMKQILWWLTWAVLFGYLAVIPLILGIPLTGAQPSGSWRLAGYVCVPLAAAIGIRWLLLARIGSTVGGYVLLLVGVVLADMAGMMTLFLGPAHRTALYGLCLLASFQFIPLWLMRSRKSDGSLHSA